jgi:hypothetical protein
MTGRIYSVSFADVSVSADQDLIAVYSGSNKAFKVHSVTIGQKTATAVGNLSVTLKRLTSLTAGSGGSTPTPVPMNPGDAAATITAHANDTTQATGTAVILGADDINVINGWLYMPPAEDRPVIGLNSALVVSLNTAPGSAETFSGTAVVEELF